MINMPIGMNPGGQYYSKKSTSPRGNLSVRLSIEERRQLEKQAKQQGIPLSVYCRMMLLTPESEARWPKRELASALCQHNRLVDRYVRNEETKKELKMWEETIWRLIR